MEVMFVKNIFGEGGENELFMNLVTVPQIIWITKGYFNLICTDHDTLLYATLHNIVEP
jgi:hypothetical protein